MAIFISDLKLKKWGYTALNHPSSERCFNIALSNRPVQVREALVTRKRLERIFGLIHYLIVEIAILVLSAIAVWHLLSRH
jgi:hypothetical protein